MDAAASIRATIAPWCKACLERDWDTLLRMCTDDVEFAPPGEPAVPRSRARAWLEAFPIQKAFEFTFDRIDVSGDLAVATGNGTWILDVNGQERSESFKFADVFRKGADGTWRYAYVIFNLTTAAAAAS
jgi:ketosteroid isomerase-like protein